MASFVEYNKALKLPTFGHHLALVYTELGIVEVSIASCKQRKTPNEGYHIVLMDTNDKALEIGLAKFNGMHWDLAEDWDDYEDCTVKFWLKWEHTENDRYNPENDIEQAPIELVEFYGLYYNVLDLPHRKFYAYCVVYKNWVAVDNSSGSAYTEAFSTKEEAIAYLNY